jgi:ABC-2 type transport system ATP-binding protein
MNVRPPASQLAAATNAATGDGVSDGQASRQSSSTDTPAIVVGDLMKTYRDGWLSKRAVHALSGVSFSVGRGEIFGLLGPNGAGKTTLIKILLGIVRPSSGQASLLGRPPGDRTGRRRVGYLPENHRFPRHHTAHSALAYFGGLSGLSAQEVRRRQDEILAMVGLEEWGDVNVRKYSKGMQQRLGLAQALLHDPELFILDEPTDGVDPVGRSEMRSLLLRLKKAGKTIFLNSHHLQEIELVCDRVAILQNGLVRREGRVADLTLAPHTELYLTLSGSEPAIREAIGQREVRRFERNEAGEFVLTVRVEDQNDANALVDALRGRGIAIVALSRHRQTLEEAFLSILAEGERVDLADSAHPAVEDERVGLADSAHKTAGVKSP